MDIIKNLSKQKKIILSLILLIMSLIVILLLTSNAFLKPVTSDDAITNVNLSTCGYFQLLNEENSINLTNSYPMSDNKGMNTEPYSFDVKNTCSSDSSFKIYLVVTNDSTIDDANIKLSLGDEIYLLSDLEKDELDEKKLNEFNSNISKEIKQVYILDIQSIAANESKSYEVRIWIDENAGNEVSGLNFNGVIAVTDSSVMTLADVILKNNGGRSAILAKGDPDFTEIATTNEGMYAMEDDYGMSYYFRGAVDNNWIYYYGEWGRIIRINGNGSVKVIWSGKFAPTEEEAVNSKSQSYDPGSEVDSDQAGPVYSDYILSDDNMYVGFMYEKDKVHGRKNQSFVQRYIEGWLMNDPFGFYKDNEVGFCNDRQPSSVLTSIDGIGGTGDTVTYYAPRIRMEAGAGILKPTFKCAVDDDYFYDDFALVTYDEVVAAGSVYGATNDSFYLYDIEGLWTMSPSHFDGNNAYVLGMDKTGYLSAFKTNTERSIRPVFNFNKYINFESGSGMWNDPYVVTNPDVY